MKSTRLSSYHRRRFQDKNHIMHIREYQEWLEAWDKARGWERVSLSHTFVHATEELGEVGRLILQWEGYKDMPDPEVWRAQMAEELSDVLVFLD